MGFAVAALALLLGLFPQPVFSELRKHWDYGSVFTDPKLAIYSLATTTLFAFGATLAVAAEVYNPLILSTALGLTGWSAATLAHALRILWLAVQAQVKAEQDF